MSELADGMMGRTRVAVVDDEPAIRKSLERFLNAAGFEVHVHASGQDLLGQWQTYLPDCVLIDLQMAGLNGFEVSDRLRRAGARMRVIIMTANPDPELQRRSVSLGVDLFVLKPLDGEWLIKEIRKMVHQEDAQRVESPRSDHREGLSRSEIQSQCRPKRPRYRLLL